MEKKYLKKIFFKLLIICVLLSLFSCVSTREMDVKVYETCANGNSLKQITNFSKNSNPIKITLNPEEQYQTITGFGGAFTESSAFLVNKLSESNRKKIMNAYFSEDGANYSLTRTHINSCDFSLKHYAYDLVDGDKNLDHFSIDQDKKNNLIPMILEAKAISKEGFKIIASPWTSPPWMKDNKNWVGGKLLHEYYDTWALYFSKYIDAYKKEGIDIWGVTVENEPHGNGNNWESMLYSPQEMTNFVQNYLGPTLKKEGKSEIKILGYDQNRAGIKEWVNEMYKDEKEFYLFVDVESDNTFS
jgi:glucosylceramidase